MKEIFVSNLGVILAAVTATLAGSMASILPKVWQWLTVKIHGEKVLLLRQSLANRAIVEVEIMHQKQGTVDGAVNALAYHMQHISLPDTVRSMKLTPDQLLSMARAAIYKAMRDIGEKP